MRLWQWEEETSPPQKLAKKNSSDNSESSRSGNISRWCFLFITLLAKAAN